MPEPSDTDRLDWILDLISRGDFGGLLRFTKYMLDRGDGREVIDGIMEVERGQERDSSHLH